MTGGGREGERGGERTGTGGKRREGKGRTGKGWEGTGMEVKGKEGRGLR